MNQPIYASLSNGAGVVFTQEEREHADEELPVGVYVIDSEGNAAFTIMGRDEAEEMIDRFAQWLKDTFVEEITRGSSDRE